MLIEFEVWRPVRDWERVYEVSSLGRVRRVAASPRHPVTGRALAGTIERRSGYRKVVLSCADHRQTRPIHVLVCEAFHGRRPKGADVRHLDGDSLNNLATNLAWGDRSRNNRDAVAHGTNAQTARTVCPLGHALVVPNLVLSRAKLGQRNCRACAQGRAAVRRARRNGIELSLRSVAGIAYRRMVAD